MVCLHQKQKRKKDKCLPYHQLVCAGHVLHHQCEWISNKCFKIAAALIKIIFEKYFTTLANINNNTMAHAEKVTQKHDSWTMQSCTQILAQKIQSIQF